MDFSTYRELEIWMIQEECHLMAQDCALSTRKPTLGCLPGSTEFVKGKWPASYDPTCVESVNQRWVLVPRTTGKRDNTCYEKTVNKLVIINFITYQFYCQCIHIPQAFTVIGGIVSFIYIPGLEEMHLKLLQMRPPFQIAPSWTWKVKAPISLWCDRYGIVFPFNSRTTCSLTSL